MKAKMVLPVLAITLALCMKSYSNQLPSSGMPVYWYNLHLNFTEDTFTLPPYEYDAYLEIAFSLFLSYPSDIKMLAAKDFITLKSVSLDVNNSVTNITSFDIDDNDILTLSDTQVAKTYAYNSYLHIRYTSRLSVNDMYGLYRTAYTTNGRTKYAIASQFEPVFARRVFPCLDEPIFRSEFRLNVTHPNDMGVYFNTIEDDSLNFTDIDDGMYATTYFKPTGGMAPYMAGLLVTHATDFTCSVGNNFTRDSVYYYRVCSRTAMETARQLALEVGPAVMADLYNVTGSEYGIIMSFPKMDLMALPIMVESASGNLGLITFREQNLLFDEENSSNLDKQNIAEMITFEFAQMWFGNMATPVWWNYAYMTKGLAYYLGILVTDRVYEDWDLYNQIIYRVLQPSLELDSLRNSPSLRNGVNSSVEIMTKFDRFVLLKGACLHRMLNEVIAGYKNYRQGLEYFITSFRRKTFQPQDLWNLISAQININNPAQLPGQEYLKDVLINWEVNAGFPLIEVTRMANGSVTVAQKGRFLYTNLDTSFQWYIPVSYVFSSAMEDFANTTLDEYILPNTTLRIELPSSDEKWIMFNTQAAGYYRVHYGDMWLNISTALQQSNFSFIPELNRAQLLNDVFALARANFLKYSFVFDFLAYIVEEESLYPWMTAINGMKYLLRRVGDASSLGLKVEARFLPYLSKVYSSVPWAKTDENNQSYSIKQIEILGEACTLGHLDCVRNAVSQFRDFKNSGKRPHKNLRSIVYCTGLLYGADISNWDVLWNAYGTTELAAERVKILSALGCSENEELLQRSLSLTLDETSGIKPQDASLVFTSVYSTSKVGANVALKFLIQNHQKIAERYQDMNCLRNTVLGLAEHLTENDQISQLRQFLRNTGNLAEEIKSVADQALEITDINVIWLDNHLEELKQYFQVS